MSLQDPISDFLTRIRNATMTAMLTVSMPNSKIKEAMCQVLKEEGFILGYSVDSSSKPTLTVELKYFDGVPVLEELQRISRPGLRAYRTKDTLPRVNGGLGIAIVSTNQGLMTDHAARRAGIGGEVLCTVF